eukprot:23351-Eustigmatos_ZCMA.PRE.1
MYGRDEACTEGENKGLRQPSLTALPKGCMWLFSRNTDICKATGECRWSCGDSRSVDRQTPTARPSTMPAI